MQFKVQKNGLEIIIIEPGEYMGTRLVHCQIVKVDAKGRMSRTGKGLSLRRETWAEVVGCVNVLLNMDNIPGGEVDQLADNELPAPP